MVQDIVLDKVLVTIVMIFKGGRAVVWFWQDTVGWVGVVTVPVRDVLSEGMEFLKDSLASTYTTSDAEVRLVSVKQLEMLEVIGDIEVKIPFSWTQWAHQSHLQ